MSRPRLREQRALFVLLLLALAVRLFRVDWRGLWLDEAYSALLATGSWENLFALLRTDSGPPLYYAVLKGWVSIFGASETALRLPSVVAGTATVGAAWAVGRRLRFGVGSELAAAGLAVSPLLIFHAQDARYYAFLPLLGLLALLALVRVIERGDRVSQGWYVLTLVVAFYFHNYGLFLPVAAMAAAWVWRRGVRWRALHVTHAIAYAAYLPWLPTLRAQMAHGGTDWVARVFSSTAPLRSVEAFVPGGLPPEYIAIPTGDGPRGLAFGLLGLTVALAAMALLRRARESPAADLELVAPKDACPPFTRRVLSVVAYAITPWALAYGFSLVARPIYIPARTDQFGVGVLAVAVAASISRWPRPVWIVYAGLVAALSAWSWWGYAALDMKSGDRSLATFVEEVAADHPVVVAADLSVTPLRYYVGRRSVPVDVVAFPPDMEEHPGNIARRRVLENPRVHLNEFEGRLSRAIATAGNATFLVISPANRLGELLHHHVAMVAERDPTATATFRMGVIGLPLEVSRYRWRTGGRPRPQSDG